MSDNFIEAPAEPAENHYQLIAAIILGIAATLTAVSSYMAAVVDGDAQAGRADPAPRPSHAHLFYSQANQPAARHPPPFLSYPPPAPAQGPATANPPPHRAP